MKPKAVVLFTLPMFMVLGFLWVAPSFAQDTPSAEVQAPPLVTPAPVQLRPVRYTANASGTTLDSKVVMVPLQSLDSEMLGNFARPLEVSVYPDTSGEKVVLAGTEEAIVKVQEFINLFNAPPEPDKNVLLTFYVVTTGKESLSPGLQLEPPIMDKIRQLLNTTLGIGQFSVWDTLFLRARDNNTAELSGFLPAPGETPENESWPTSFQIRVTNVAVTMMGEEPSRIALDDLMCGIELGVSVNTGPNNQPRPISRQNVGFKSNMDMREGQLEIVSKTSISSDGDSVIIIVSAQVLKD